MKKKIFGLLLAGLLLLPTVTQAAFSDMPSPAHWSFPAIVHAIQNKILNGFPDETIRPDASLTRAEAATILVRVFKGEEKNTFVGFRDVPQSAWFYDAVASAVKMGFFKGVNETEFLPNASITRQEILVAVARAKGLTEAGKTLTFSDKDDVAAWAQDAISAMHEKGYVGGDNENRILPQKQISRAEFAQILYNISKKDGGAVTPNLPTPGGNGSGPSTNPSTPSTPSPENPDFDMEAGDNFVDIDEIW